ncbi:short-chain dehydrogenase [Seiridium cupressi]
MASLSGTLAPRPRVHEGKLTIVTGSARSIGAAIVRDLASRGCNFIINYLTEKSIDAARELAQELERDYDVKAIPVKADISKKDQCTLITDDAQKHFADSSTGKVQIDIIVHNAGILYLGPIEDVIEDEFHKIYAVNVLGPTFLTAACIPYLPTDRSGRIVILPSINSKVGTPHTTLYSGTKGALEAMARVWCRELAERATVNTINPGPVMTDMYLSAPEEVKKGLALWNPLTPLAPVRETDAPEVRELGRRLGGRGAYAHGIAQMVAMICSPDSAWCTGSLISSNGGLTFSY